MFRTPIKEYDSSFDASTYLDEDYLWEDTSEPNPQKVFFLCTFKPVDSNVQTDCQVEQTDFSKELALKEECIEDITDMLNQAKEEIKMLKKKNADIVTDFQLNESKLRAKVEFLEREQKDSYKILQENNELKGKCLFLSKKYECMKFKLRETVAKYKHLIQDREDRYASKENQSRDEQKCLVDKINALKNTITTLQNKLI